MTAAWLAEPALPELPGPTLLGRLAARQAERAAEVSATPAAALVLGVVGARGGAGAGVLAACLARCSAVLGRSTLLVDADPSGTGVAWTFAGAAAGEVSTPVLGAAHGRLLPGTLLAALPEVDGVHLLSRAPWGPELPEETLPEVLDSTLRDFEVLVVDLPRRADPVSTAFTHALDVGLVVVPAEPAAMRGAQHLTARLSSEVRDLRVVVRGPEPRDLSWQEIERVLNLPVEARLPPEPGLDRALARGEPPGLRRRSPLSATATGILQHVFEQLETVHLPARDRPLASRRPANGSDRHA